MKRRVIWGMAVLLMALLLCPIVVAGTDSNAVLLKNIVPTNNPINKSPGVTVMPQPSFEKKKVGIKEACKVLREIMLPLEKGIRADVIKNLPPGQLKTFSALKQDLDVPSTTLHSNLKALLDLGYVDKTDERPARYFSTPDVEYVRSIATALKERQLEALRNRLEAASAEVEI